MTRAGRDQRHQEGRGGTREKEVLHLPQGQPQTLPRPLPQGRAAGEEEQEQEGGQDEEEEEESEESLEDSWAGTGLSRRLRRGGPRKRHWSLWLRRWGLTRLKGKKEEEQG